MTPNIYKIDQSHYDLRDTEDINLIINRIISISLVRLNRDQSFDSNRLKHIVVEEISYYLYVFENSEYEAPWASFLPREFTSNFSMVSQKTDLILFVNTEPEIYCLIGGLAYQIIVPFIDHSFGLNTFSKIMIPESDEIMSIQSRSFTGQRVGLNEQYKDSFRIIDYVRFGRVPKSIHLKLSQLRSNDHFSFLKEKDDDRMLIEAGKAFKIKKNITFLQLCSIVKELIVINELAESDYLSSFEEVSDKEVIDSSLMPILIGKIYNDSEYVISDVETSDKRFEFDFCNPNSISAFFEADEYVLTEKSKNNGNVEFNRIYDKEGVYRAVVQRAVEKVGRTDEFEFSKYLYGVRVRCYRNGVLSRSSGFLYHFTSEFSIGTRSVFLIDSKWYELKSSFIEDLQLKVKQLVSSYSLDPKILNIPWDKSKFKTEALYNNAYVSNPNMLNLDTVIVNGIELGDLLYFDHMGIYIIHVKYGFDSRIRELSNQIRLSAKRLKDAKLNKDDKYFEDLFNLLELKNRNSNNLSLDQFKALFKKKIRYVMAFASHKSSDLNLEENIDKYRSNIAKYSLVNCSNEMRAGFYDLFICQIPKS